MYRNFKKRSHHATTIIKALSDHVQNIGRKIGAGTQFGCENLGVYKVKRSQGNT